MAENQDNAEVREREEEIARYRRAAEETHVGFPLLLGSTEPNTWAGG